MILSLHTRMNISALCTSEAQVYSIDTPIHCAEEQKSPGINSSLTLFFGDAQPQQGGDLIPLMLMQ